jgi:hypothetical protein
VANPHPNIANLRPFPKGVSGNPGGKPVGARNRLRGDFMRDIVVSWEKHGAACLERLGKNDPLSYVRISAMIVSRELTVDGLEPPSWEDRVGERERENEQLHERIRAALERQTAENPPIVSVETVPPALNEPRRGIELQPLKISTPDKLTGFRASETFEQT